MNNINDTLKEKKLWIKGCQFLSNDEKYELLFSTNKIQRDKIYKIVNEKLLTVARKNSIGEVKLTNRNNKQFKKEVEELANQLIKRYCGTIRCSFKWNNKKKCVGQCFNRKYHGVPEMDYTIIFLSYWGNVIKRQPIEEIKDTLLHEIAHALVGNHHKHNEIWRQKALEIGCSGEIYRKVEFLPPLLATCPKCGLKFHRFRKSDIACKRCCVKYNNGTYTPLYSFKWTRTEQTE